MPRVTSLSLDYGADGQECSEDSIEFSEQAMHMRSRWRFDLGTQIGVSFVCHTSDGARKRLIAEGIVVGCDRCPEDPKLHQTTLLFLELPDDLQQCLRELAFRG